MAKEAEKIGGGSGTPWRLFGWSTAALLLLLPLAAKAPWTLSDYVFAAVLIGGVGLLFELAVRMSHNWAYRGGIAAVLMAIFVTIWASAAVGMIGDGDHPLNLMFFAIVLLAFIGAVLVRFRAAGMARVMTAAAIAQFLAGTVGAFTDLRGGIASASFGCLWLLSAMLFGKAARDEGTEEAARSG